MNKQYFIYAYYIRNCCVYISRAWMGNLLSHHIKLRFMTIFRIFFIPHLSSWHSVHWIHFTFSLFRYSGKSLHFRIFILLLFFRFSSLFLFCAMILATSDFRNAIYQTLFILMGAPPPSSIQHKLQKCGCVGRFYLKYVNFTNDKRIFGALLQ